MNKTKMIAIGFAGVVTVISAWLVANGFTNFKKDAPTINVTGMAEKQITSDLIVWNITVNAEDVSRSDAFSAYKKTAKLLRRYLNDHGIPDKEISTNSVDISKQTKEYYDSDEKRYFTVDKGYSASQTFTVSSHDVSNVERVYQNISELYNHFLFKQHTVVLLYQAQRAQNGDAWQSKCQRLRARTGNSQR